MQHTHPGILRIGVNISNGSEKMCIRIERTSIEAILK